VSWYGRVCLLVSWRSWPKCVFSEAIGKRKLGSWVPYLIYVIHVELHHTIGLLGLFHQRKRKHAPPSQSCAWWTSFLAALPRRANRCCYHTGSVPIHSEWGIAQFGQWKGRGAWHASHYPRHGFLAVASVFLYGTNNEVSNCSPCSFYLRWVGTEITFPRHRSWSLPYSITHDG
jgi:hypothetical protein